MDRLLQSVRHVATILVVAMFGLTSAFGAAASGGTFSRSGVVKLAAGSEGSPIDRALVDLAADFERVLGARASRVSPAQADVMVRIDPQVEGPERWRITIAADRVTIAGSDLLGAVHGVYAFSERALGVDPLWFWKSVEPEAKERLVLETQTWESPPAKFRYRGWFINDEDLLTEFGQSGGPRHIDYPFYAQVIDYAMAERIYEALLRLGGNLIIPASFVDILNPAEAELVRRAAARGLYVSQHHVEPMGVSHFGFENYWRARGAEKKFGYSTDPESVRTVWRAHAQRWYEIAGDRVIWQLGMRGRGDRPIWIDDKNITRATGGDFISRAMADQADIVRSVDPRPNPPMTSTLFLEGADLMASGELKFPAGLTVVFADHGPSQEMQSDFHKAPRLPEYRYGFYYHAAFWRRGPHLAPGIDPERMHRVFRELEARGDTEYAIVNVSNVREHVLGAHVFVRTALHGAARPLQATLAEFAPLATDAFRRAYFAALVQDKEGAWVQDGDCVEAVELFLAASERKAGVERLQRRFDPALLERAAAALEAVASAGDLATVPERWRDWTRDHYIIQGRHLAALHRVAASLTRNDVPMAIKHLERALAERAALATGPWEGWYVGDKKANWPDKLARLKALHL